MKFKVQLITRSFFEDAYLEFFIKYYLDLGFDRLVIFKADEKELGKETTEAILDKFTDEEKNKILLKYVKNEGNGIYTNPVNFQYYIDEDYEWTLHNDLDEFLIINREKYKTVHDYILDIHNIMNVEYNTIDTIKLRWLCINKLNDNWDLNNIEEENIINPELKSDHSQEANNYSMYNYLLTNKFEIYKFIKGLYKTSSMCNIPNKNNAHFNVFKHNVKNNKNNHNNNIVIDNTFTKVNNIKSPLFTDKEANESKKNFCNGFILHLNTRSYSNSLTKCLVTQLRDNKKIKSLPDFTDFINNLKVNDISKLDKTVDSDLEEINIIKEKYKSFLNSKAFFPNKIKRFHNKYNYLIDPANYISQLKSIIENNKELIFHYPVINIDIENRQLSKLCEEKSINYDNLRVILNLF